jgi:FkbM family methyltransferase
MSRRNNALYNAAKDAFFRRILYRSLRPVWRGDHVEIGFRGGRYRFARRPNTDTPRLYIGPYFHPDLSHSFLGEEVAGYLLERAVQPGDTVLDGGAYHGTFAVVAARLAGPAGRVFAFEPIESNAAVLRENLRLNAAENVTVVTAGLAERTGRAMFAECGIGSAIHPRGRYEAAVVSIDDFARERGLDAGAPLFVKMDIEGAEVEALRGAREMLRRATRAFLAIATYHVRDGRTTSGAVESELRDLGYETVTRHPRHLTTFAWKGGSR